MPRHNDNAFKDREMNAAETKPQPQRSVLKTTSEQIVRDFRMNEGFNTYEAARSLRPLCRRIRRPFFLIRWFKAINWDLFYIWGRKELKRARGILKGEKS